MGSHGLSWSVRAMDWGTYQGLGQQILIDGGGGSLVTNWPPMDKSLTMPPSFSSASTTHRLFCFRFLLSYEKYLKNLRPDQVKEIFLLLYLLLKGGGEFFMYSKKVKENFLCIL